MSCGLQYKLVERTTLAVITLLPLVELVHRDTSSLHNEASKNNTNSFFHYKCPNFLI